MLILSNPAEMADLIVRSEQAGTGYRAPLYRAAAAGLICIAECNRGGRIPSRLLKAPPGPLLVCLGDDDYTATGPAGWPQARQLLRWAKNVMLHGAGGEAKHYAAAVVMTTLEGRTLLVETDTVHLPEWLALVRACRPTPSGLVLAVPPDRSANPMLARTKCGALQ